MNLYCVKDTAKDCFYVMADDEAHAQAKWEMWKSVGTPDPQHRDVESVTLLAMPTPMEGEPWAKLIL